MQAYVMERMQAFVASEQRPRSMQQRVTGLVIAIEYGRPPWVALVLAFSFGMYGFCKRRANVGAVDSLTVETGVQFVPALIAIAVIGAQGDLAFGTHADASLSPVGLEVITVVPLLFFRRRNAAPAALHRRAAAISGARAAIRRRVGIRHESLPAAEFVGFCLV
jgi:chloramphenicol-sensitive protein RarD